MSEQHRTQDLRVEQIKRNSGRCVLCNDNIESRHRHDMRFCKCGAVAVDGGHSYRRRVGDPKHLQDTSIVVTRHDGDPSDTSDDTCK